MTSLDDDRKRMDRIRAAVNLDCYAWIEDSNWLLNRLTLALAVVVAARHSVRAHERRRIELGRTFCPLCKSLRAYEEKK